MGFDYLNEDAVFYCLAMPVVKFKCDAGQRRVYANGKPVLTVDAKISSMSKMQIQTKVCPILKPKTCQCNLTGWNNFGKAKADGKTVLISRPVPVNLCAFGSPILIKSSGVRGKAEQGFAPNISSISWQELYKDNAKAKETKTPALDTPDIPEISDVSEAAAIGGAVAGNFEQEDKKSGENKNNKAVKAEAVAVKENKAKENAEAKVEEKAKEQPKTNLICPYTDCEKCRGCAYPKASTEVDNDSQKLRQSYAALDDVDKDDYDRYYERVNEQYGTTRWTYAAHHIISGNQVFKPHPEIVRLANFYGYDINCAENCIFLVSKEDDYGSRVKSVSAYDAMSEAKMQWHLGGHSYSFDAETLDMLYKQIAAQTHTQPQRPLKNYMQLLSDELGKMEQSLMSRRVCRNTPQQKAAFIKRMNNLAQKIKQHLAAFRYQPAQSYPYYVSKEAYLYTFSLPSTTKVIFAQSVPEGLKMQLFRVGRDKEQIKDKGSQIFSMADVDSRRDCITFCTNAEHFLFIEGDSTAETALPFKPEYSKKLPLIPLEADGYMRHYASDILVWLRDTQTNYTAPLRKINERLKEVNNR